MNKNKMITLMHELKHKKLITRMHKIKQNDDPSAYNKTK
jgi:hypothetical protein